MFCRLAAFLCLLALPLHAADYLTDQAKFSAAWEKLVARIGTDAMLAEVVVAPEEITASVRSANYAAATDVWTVRKGFFGPSVSGPRPEPFARPVAVAFYPLAEVAPDGLIERLSTALAAVTLQEPGMVTTARLARPVAILGDAPAGEARWSVSVRNARESATVDLTTGGAVIGMDITQTAIGLSRDFLTQSEWPFALAAEGLGNLVGPDPVVTRVSVSRTSVSVEALTPGSKDRTTSYSWDGGRFTRGMMDMPSASLMIGNAPPQFRVADARIAAIPEILAAARAAAPPGLMILDANAETDVPVGRPPELVWRVSLGPRPRRIGEMDFPETLVTVRPDSTLVSVLLPEGLRPKDDFLDPAQMQVALDAFKSVAGDQKIFEIVFRPERASIRRPVAGNPAAIEVTDYTGKGLANGMGSFTVMETEEDLFPLATLIRVEAPQIDKLKADALAALAIDGAVIHEIRVWSGQPFWRTKSGDPVISVRAGIPPRYDTGGYVVFFLDGRVIEAVK